MNHKLGFACIIETNDKQLKEKYKVNRRITLKRAEVMDKDELYNEIKQKTRANFDGLYNVIQFNIENGIKLYRLSSDMIILDGLSINKYKFWEDEVVINLCAKIKKMAEDNNISLSSHISPYCVLASANPDVVKKSIDMLISENRVANLVGHSTICMHIGTKQGGKSESMERFIDGYLQLSEDLQSKICLENTENGYTIGEILEVCETVGCRAIWDLHHHRINLSTTESNESIVQRIKSTWDTMTPKVHLSSGKDDILDRKHADYITEEDYKWCMDITKGEFNIMMECKAKQLAVFRIKELTA